MPGAEIGDGSIAAACSVITGKFPPYSLIGGNPARLIRRRFNEERIHFLLRLKWWDLPPEELSEILPLLCDPDLEKAEEELRRRYRL